MKIQRWSDLTGPELARVAADDPVALLPVAAIEQHGPHLPLATDVLIGQGILEVACRELAVTDESGELLLLPCVAPGASLEHTHFAGTLSLPVELLIRTLRAVGASVARAGIRRLVVFNSHGGNRAAIDAAALQLRAECGLLVVKAHYFRFKLPPGTVADAELLHGIHGGLVETALMLHLQPDRVRRAALADFDSLGAARALAGLTLGPEGDAGFAWLAEDLNPAGVCGAAAHADAALGAKLATAYGQRLAAIVRETAAFDLATLGIRADGPGVPRAAGQ